MPREREEELEGRKGGKMQKKKKREQERQRRGEEVERDYYGLKVSK
jgi:hypothetical protein